MGVKQTNVTKEQERLDQPSTGPVDPWRKWGPYVSERAWGTVREDYSSNGDAWNYFPHELARSKAYRWGEDGLAGLCDRYQILVLTLALWNGKDPILKERLFGLVPAETNHGEDVKEYYFYLDSTPTHSYMKYLYKYPQAAYPYQQLLDGSHRRGDEGEYELSDTGVFDAQRYFDVFVEYAKEGPEDISIRIEVFNRGPEAAPIHVLPHLWFRNTWSWASEPQPQPRITLGSENPQGVTLVADDTTAAPLSNLPFRYRLGPRYLYGDASATALFTDNETNGPRVWGAEAQSRSPWVKDGFHRHVVHGEATVNPAQEGTKACLHFADRFVPAGNSLVFRLRFSDQPMQNPLADVDDIVAARRKEADEFYETVHPAKASADERMVQRQALAGMLWSKQIYLYDVHVWLDGDSPNWPPPASRRSIRNKHWLHLNSMRIMSMPDKWEYPWFAAWDLAFQSVALALVDPAFAKQQLWLLLFEQFQHPNGQIPAYEWEFSDLNPPVHAWAVWRVYNMDRVRSGQADRTFLERCFHKLLINFTWWVNKVDSEGNNVFEGGFLGLDNITVIDRSEKLPGGVSLKQSDATGWMGMFCLSMMRMALELAHENKVYESLATKFFEHYVYIGAAMKKMGGGGYELWSETDGFFYDALCYPDGTYHKFRVRSLVGLIPLYAIERLEEKWLEPFTEFRANLHWFLDNRQDIVQRCVSTIKTKEGAVHVLAIINPEQMQRLLQCIWDPSEFRSGYGLRSLSKLHEKEPYAFGNHTVRYDPGESLEQIKGGNSNWRGPIWFPTTFLMIESLRKLRKAYGHGFAIPSLVSGEPDVTLDDISKGFADRLIRLFTRDESGKRAVHGGLHLFQEDPHWRDLLLFYEYFHGDTGKGLGASHQTGWTGLVANLIDEWRR
jgi:Mannosylglycerate hydrolase MGH1-like glycoside hydrolase domain